MRVSFIVPCLEPGKDGVGDYTLMLAAECAKAGWECCIAALNDPFVNGTEEETKNGLAILRIGQKMARDVRDTKLNSFLSGFIPDWLSLQFVSYGFNRRGLVWNLGKRLQPLVAAARRHIMYHELWIGGVKSPLRHRLTGAVQRWLIRRMHRQWSPSVVHTSNGTYVRRLRNVGINAAILPLFGAVPVGNKTADEWLFPILQEGGIAINAANRSQYWIFGFFGTLHSVWPPEPLFSKLRETASQNDKKVVLISAGRIGGGEALWKQMAARYKTEFAFFRLGEMAPERVSEWLNSLDFGVATTPLAIIGKSASVAAMLEHGLPVIVNREDQPGTNPWEDGFPELEEQLIRLTPDFPNRLRTAKREIGISRLPKVAEQFQRDLRYFGAQAVAQTA